MMTICSLSFLSLGVSRQGLTWWIILQMRDSFRQTFDYFSPKKVAMYTEQDVEGLMADNRLIRNKTKILAAINNAKCFLEAQREFGSFDAFIWQFVKGQTITNTFVDLANLILKLRKHSLKLLYR
jgi:DNA-3-methyladenine glycosylase I